MLKIVLFDMDGTIVQYNSGPFQSSWDVLKEAAGFREEGRKRQEYYLDKPNLYDEWFAKDCSSLAGKKVAPIWQQLLPVPYTPGFLECCTYLKSKSVKLGIVSNGLGLVAEKIKLDVFLDVVFASELHIKDGMFTGTGEMGLHILEKGKKVKEILEQQDISSKEAAFVGDHFNDIPAWKEVGIPIGMNLKDKRCHLYVQQHFENFHQALEFFRERLG